MKCEMRPRAASNATRGDGVLESGESYVHLQRGVASALVPFLLTLSCPVPSLRRNPQEVTCTPAVKTLNSCHVLSPTFVRPFPLPPTAALHVALRPFGLRCTAGLPPSCCMCLTTRTCVVLASKASLHCAANIADHERQYNCACVPGLVCTKMLTCCSRLVRIAAFNGLS